jgi:hypothetical protein
MTAKILTWHYCLWCHPENVVATQERFQWDPRTNAPAETPTHLCNKHAERWDRNEVLAESTCCPLCGWPGLKTDLQEHINNYCPKTHLK